MAAAEQDDDAIGLALTGGGRVAENAGGAVAADARLATHRVLLAVRVAEWREGC